MSRTDDMDIKTINMQILQMQFSHMKMTFIWFEAHHVDTNNKTTKATASWKNYSIYEILSNPWINVLTDYGTVEQWRGYTMNGLPLVATCKLKTWHIYSSEDHEMVCMFIGVSTKKSCMLASQLIPTINWGGETDSLTYLSMPCWRYWIRS
jgi:hypothetical protein